MSLWTYTIIGSRNRKEGSNMKIYGQLALELINVNNIISKQEEEKTQMIKDEEELSHNIYLENNNDNKLDEIKSIINNRNSLF